jgi:hypothetical protein
MTSLSVVEVVRMQPLSKLVNHLESDCPM